MSHSALKEECADGGSVKRDPLVVPSDRRDQTPHFTFVAYTPSALAGLSPYTILQKAQDVCFLIESSMTVCVLTHRAVVLEASDIVRHHRRTLGDKCGAGPGRGPRDVRPLQVWFSAGSTRLLSSLPVLWTAVRTDPRDA